MAATTPSSPNSRTNCGREDFSVERAAFDVADAEAVRAFFGGLKRLDILVNNAVSMKVKVLFRAGARRFRRDL